MPKHDPPGDDAALLELERELMELDRAIAHASMSGSPIADAIGDRRCELAAKIFETPAAGLEGLAAQARTFLTSRPVRARARGAGRQILSGDR